MLYKVIVHRKSGKIEGCNGDEEMLRTRYKESRLRKEEAANASTNQSCRRQLLVGYRSSHDQEDILLDDYGLIHDLSVA